MKSCLILTSTDTATMPSEAQEVVNLLTKNQYTVQLLQSNVTSLELYRTLQRGPYPLVWVAAHSGEAGFVFASTLITPTELGQFLEEAQAQDLILNSCYSAEHVTTIQQICNANIIATIKPDVEDKIAWSSALYLAAALVRTGNLREAYQTILTGSGSVYRFFPALKSNKRTMIPDEDRIGKLEKALEQVSRIVYGDPYLHAPGVIDALDSLREIVKKRIESDDQWKRDTENRIKANEDRQSTTEKESASREIRLKSLEASTPGSTVILTRHTLHLMIYGFVAIMITIIILVWFFGHS